MKPIITFYLKKNANLHFVIDIVACAKDYRTSLLKQTISTGSYLILPK